jgi:CRP-like cAMP-binding protein
MLGNTTLETLSPADMAALRPYLRERSLDEGLVLTAQGEEVDTIYFPTSAQLANFVRFENGGMSESFFMGSEGVSGLAAFLADGPCAWSVEVRRSGRAFELPAAVLRDRFQESAALRDGLLSLAYDYQAQSSLAAACGQQHTVQARLATVLALLSQKLGVTTLDLTQDDLGRILGVQRTTVNAGSLLLRNAGAIKYSRGHIHIVDRRRLREAACECLQLYDVIRPHRHGHHPGRPYAA